MGGCLKAAADGERRDGCRRKVEQSHLVLLKMTEIPEGQTESKPTSYSATRLPPSVSFRNKNPRVRKSNETKGC